MKQMQFLLVLISLFFACSMDSNPPADPVAPTAPEGTTQIKVNALVEYVIGGSNMSAEVQLLDDNSQVIDTATVKVDNAALLLSVDQWYRNSSLTDVGVAGNVGLDIQAEGHSITATESMPEAPSITTPGNSSSQDATNPITVSWSFTTAPSYVRIWIARPYTTSGLEFEKVVSASAGSYDIPAGTIKTPQTTVVIHVGGANKETALGTAAATGSQFLVCRTDSVSISTP